MRPCNFLSKGLNILFNPNLYKQNEFSDDGHIEVYQSDHNLNQMESFFAISKTL